MMIVISLLYPISLFFVLRYLGLHLDDVMALKLLPLLMSIYVTFLMLLSYVKKDSFILKFAKKFSKYELDEKEITYIKQSSLFWIIVSLINVVLHVVVLNNEYYWLVYTSIGWYGVFVCAGVVQYLHRKFVFLKRVEDV